MRIVAVDWSGRRTGARRAIWLAEVRDHELVRLENGRSREEIGEHLIELARADPALVVGLDFSFSLPCWFLRERGYNSVDALWRAAAAEGDAWLDACEPPFWGRSGRRRPDLPAHYRVTEDEVAAVGGIRPKSTFQVSGGGSVGTGSIRGFPVLARLRAAGFSVWPFDDGTPPVALEVWPRMLTGPVVKTSVDARAAYLAEHFPSITSELRLRATSSDDAFDAGVSALVMAQHETALCSLRRTDDPVTQIEGAVWCPPARDQATRAQTTGGQASAVTSRAADASTNAGNNDTTSLESTT